MAELVKVLEEPVGRPASEMLSFLQGLVYIDRLEVSIPEKDPQGGILARPTDHLPGFGTYFLDDWEGGEYTLYLDMRRESADNGRIKRTHTCIVERLNGQRDLSDAELRIANPELLQASHVHIVFPERMIDARLRMAAVELGRYFSDPARTFEDFARDRISSVRLLVEGELDPLLTAIANFVLRRGTYLDMSIEK